MRKVFALLLLITLLWPTGILADSDNSQTGVNSASADSTPAGPLDVDQNSDDPSNTTAKILNNTYEVIKHQVELAKYIGDAAYEYNYDLSVSWGSENAVDYEGSLKIIMRTANDTLRTIDWLFDDCGYANELIPYISSERIALLRPPEIILDIVPMHDNINGKAGIDLEYAMNAHTKFFKEKWETFIKKGAYPPLPIGIEDTEMEKETIEVFSGNLEEWLELNDDSYQGVIERRFESEIGVVSTVGVISYEDLIKRVESMEEVPEELQVYKDWINCKNEIDEYLDRCKKILVDPYADQLNDE